MASTDTQVHIQQVYERSFEAGALIFDEGDPGDSLFVIQSGGVEVTRQGPTGRNIVARLSSGDFFGEMSVILGEKRTARAVAISPTRLIQLDGGTLEAMCMDRPEVAILIMRRLTSRLIEAERRVSALGLDDLMRPLVRALLEIAETRSGEPAARFPTDLRGLSVRAGLSMLETHRVLHQLLDRKLVRLVDDSLVAPDLEAVAACVDHAPAAAG